VTSIFLADDGAQKLLERRLVGEARLEGVHVALVGGLADRLDDLRDFVLLVLRDLSVGEHNHLQQPHQGGLLVFIQVAEFHVGTFAVLWANVKSGDCYEPVTRLGQQRCLGTAIDDAPCRRRADLEELALGPRDARPHPGQASPKELPWAKSSTR
jgi:hypothetical protein